MIKIGTLLGIFLMSSFVYTPNFLNPILLLDNTALEYASDEWFQSPTQNVSFTPDIHTIRTISSAEGFLYSQNRSIFYFNLISNTTEQFLDDMDLLRFEFQGEKILCGWGDDAYHFYEIETRLKVHEIPSEGISEAFGGYYGPLSFMSPDFAFLGFTTQDDFVMLHQSSEGGSWTNVYEVGIPATYHEKTVTYEIDENGTEIWETGKSFVGDDYLRKYSWDGGQYLLEENYLINTDPATSSNACFMQFFSENHSLFALKVTDQYYRTINCSDVVTETRYGNLELLEWSSRCYFAEGNELDATMNMVIVGSNFTVILALPVFPNASYTYHPIDSLPNAVSNNGDVVNILMIPGSDYVFIHEWVFAAAYLYGTGMPGGGVYQHFMSCYQISTASIIWWWAIDDFLRSVSNPTLHRIHDRMLVEIRQYGATSEDVSSLVWVFDISPHGTGEVLLETTFLNPYMNTGFITINLVSLVFVILFRIKPQRNMGLWDLGSDKT